jgi:hypothetical protein
VTRAEPDAKKAMEVAAAAASLNIAGMLLDTVFWQSRLQRLPPWHLLSLGVSIVLLIYLGLRRKNPPPARFSSFAFFFHNVVISTALWFADSLSPLLPRQSTTFQPQKLGALAVAILAPPSLASGIFSILVFVGSPIVRYELFDAEIRARLSSEPWAMAAYGIFALGLYFYRTHSRRIRAEMQRAITEATSLERLSCVLLAFRDFYNTPLQTIELTIAIFKVRHPEAKHLVARLERAANRLSELNRIASTYEPTPCRIHRVSLDSAEVLERRGRPAG